MLASIQLITAQVPHVILAFCYIGILVAALGFLLNRPELVYGYVAVALIAQVPFSADLVRVYLGLEQFIGLVTYDPTYHTLAGRIVDLGVHLLVLPFVLFGLVRLEPPTYRAFLTWYVPVLSIVLLASMMVGDVNCARIGCFSSLAYGSTLPGHLLYLSIVTIIGPLIIAQLVRMAHIRLRR